MTTAYVALGSNVDNPARQLRRAVAAIAEWPSSTITAVSSVYRSAAIGPGRQADYLNAVLALSTDLTPLQLLAQLQSQENHQGRVRTVRWGARTLDLDILLYGAVQMQTDDLQIPHPSMNERPFVLYPLAEIARGDMILPCGTELDTVLLRCARGDLEKTRLALTSGANTNNTKEPGPNAG